MEEFINNKICIKEEVDLDIGTDEAVYKDFLFKGEMNLNVIKEDVDEVNSIVKEEPHFAAEDIKEEAVEDISVKDEELNHLEFKNQEKDQNKKIYKSYNIIKAKFDKTSKAALNIQEVEEALNELEEESDNELDNIEAELVYDSETHEEYPPSSSSEDNEEDILGDRHRNRLRETTLKRKCTYDPPVTYSRKGDPPYPTVSSASTETPVTSSATPVTSAATPVTSAATSLPSIATPVTSTAALVTSTVIPVTSVDSTGIRRQHEHDAPSIVEFNRSTISSSSDFRWNCLPQHSSARTPMRNIIPSFIPGPTPESQGADTPEKCFNLLFEESIILVIVRCTNQKIQQQALKYNKQAATLSPTEASEIRALLGLMIFSGYQRDNHLSTREMWHPVTGHPIYRTAMSEPRFSFLTVCLRFDDEDTREERRKTDKFAPIRNLWDSFIANCGRMYMPSENITIDEQLLAFRGRCQFRMYIPNKPSKYGIKLVLANDNKSKYLLGAIPYLGKLETPTYGNLSLGHYFTKKLTKPYHNTNRNVTTDNWFTSVPLVTDLLDNCGMTLVGTLRGNKREVPAEMKEKKNRSLGSSAFLFTTKMTLVSYIPTTSRTSKKLVLLLSSMHTRRTLGDTGKPEIIEFYNHTKGGVNTFDQMCAYYSCGRQTRRWPMCVFYGMVNACVINSWILHSENTERKGGKRLIRRRYMLELAMELIKPWAEKRLLIPTLPRSTKNVIANAFRDTLPARAEQPDLPPVMAKSTANKVRCALCDKGSYTKTRFRCHVCQTPVCMSHVYGYCGKCSEDTTTTIS